jgi:hypothetical protein
MPKDEDNQDQLAQMVMRSLTIIQADIGEMKLDIKALDAKVDRHALDRLAESAATQAQIKALGTQHFEDSTAIIDRLDELSEKVGGDHEARIRELEDTRR